MGVWLKPMESGRLEDRRSTEEQQLEINNKEKLCGGIWGALITLSGVFALAAGVQAETGDCRCPNTHPGERP